MMEIPRTITTAIAQLGTRIRFHEARRDRIAALMNSESLEYDPKVLEADLAFHESRIKSYREEEIRVDAFLKVMEAACSSD